MPARHNERVSFCRRSQREKRNRVRVLVDDMRRLESFHDAAKDALSFDTHFDKYGSLISASSTDPFVDILGRTSGVGGRTLHEAKLKAQNTYNAAADFFDDPALSFWDRFGSATIDRLNLPIGASVLDVCAGTGASALPAAVQVGPTGKVVAVDLAENLLALAEQKARRLELSNVEFRLSDVDALEYPPEYFDAVVCVFGIFFLPDMTLATERLWRMVTPG